VISPKTDKILTPVALGKKVLSLEVGGVSRMVHLSGVSKTYSSKNPVLDQVNLELKKGDFLYVIGGSGAGKSSLLRMLATEENPSAGVVSLFGYSLGSVPPGTLRAIRRALGYVPQNVRLIPDLTVYDNIAVSLSLAGRASAAIEVRRVIDQTLAKLNIQHLREKLASSISGGEAQRVAVARALVRQPELLVADEPTGAQDGDHVWMLMDALVRANLAGTTVVVATHDREIVRRIRKRCAVLRNGRMHIEGASLCT